MSDDLDGASPSDSVETRTLGACPFKSDDPRYETWLLIARWAAEVDADTRSHFLARASTVSPEQRGALLCDFAIARFNTFATVLVVRVSDYEAAGLCESAFKEFSRRQLDWFRQATHNKLGWTKGGEDHDLELRLAQRVAFWTAEALKLARERTEARHQRTDNPSLVAATWADVTIQFLSDHTFQATVKERSLSPRNYAEMGLEDRRAGKPKLAWLTLVELAEGEGHLETNSTWEKTEKRIGEI